jgi:hypothetical protein
VTGDQPGQDPVDAADRRPVLRIVKGEPTPEELAALTVLLAAASAAQAEDDQPERRGGWADPAHRLRQPLFPAPGAWQAAVRR